MHIRGQKVVRLTGRFFAESPSSIDFAEAIEYKPADFVVHAKLAPGDWRTHIFRLLPGNEDQKELDEETTKRIEAGRRAAVDELFAEVEKRLEEGALREQDKEGKRKCEQALAGYIELYEEARLNRKGTGDKLAVAQLAEYCGLCSYILNRDRSAIVYERICLGLREEELGVEHDETLQSAENLADSLAVFPKREQEALNLWKRCEQSWGVRLGLGHPKMESIRRKIDSLEKQAARSEGENESQEITGEFPGEPDNVNERNLRERGSRGSWNIKEGGE
jgi:hypothetical protein